jgi:hypothetical protein
MGYTPGSFVGEHALITGPISGTVTLEDGTVVDVTPPIIELHPDKHEEVSFLIGEHFVQHGHPHDVEHDDATGEAVQRPFVHKHPKKFDKHPAKFKGKPAGRAHSEKG